KNYNKKIDIRSRAVQVFIRTITKFQVILELKILEHNIFKDIHTQLYCPCTKIVVINDQRGKARATFCTFWVPLGVWYDS
ncbi:MAG: hypothetical protein ACE5K4_08015, partial [Candidatus Hydrothermarchaeota archaeon]